MWVRIPTRNRKGLRIKSICGLRRYDPRLDPRDSFLGGRTNALCLHYGMREEGEIIQYDDIMSVYLPVNKYFNIAKVTISHRRGILHLVLLYRSNDKLKFLLCSNCADTEALTPCICDDSQRSITGTWCTPELGNAAEKEFVVTNMEEVLQFDQTTTYDLC